MTVWYFDYVNGSDDNGGTDSTAPKKNYDQFALNNIAPGDSVLFRRGVTQNISVIYTALKSGEIGARVTYGAYGESQVPYALLTNQSAVGGVILNGANCHHINVQDIKFELGECTSSVYFAAQDAGNTYENIVRRCIFANSALGTGFGFTKAPTATGRAYNNLVEDCIAYGNGAHGFFGIVEDTIFRRLIAYNNGLTSVSGGHGISLRWARTEVTSGWTNTTGFIYARTLNMAELDVSYVSVWNGYARMRKNTSDPANPALGEFGVVGGALYVNVGANPNGIKAMYAWGRCGGNEIVDCEAHSNYRNEYTPAWEGHGIALDDFTEDSVIKSCFSHDNQGLGFSINKGNRNEIWACASRDNASSAVAVNPSDGNKIYHLTSLDDKADAGSTTAAVVTVAAGSTGTTIQNTLLVGFAAVGISTTGDSVVDSNCIVGFTTAINGATATNTISDGALNSQVMTGFSLPHSSACVSAGAPVPPWAVDLYGHRFAANPTIGAVEMKRTAYLRKQSI